MEASYRGRLLGLDFGEKRIGVALSDPTGSIAQPLTDIPATPQEAALQAIRSLVQEYGVDEVILGVPYSLTGLASPQTEACLAFGRELEAILDIPLRLVDERLTSKAAERVLISGGVGRKKRRGKVDRMAAALILQTHLDSRREPE